MNSVQPAISELERLYEAFDPLFPKQIRREKPIIIIQTKGRRGGTLGWCAPEAWTNGQPERINEITICAEELARPIADVAGTLLHEMVHHFNILQAVRDCSSSQYHNRAFRDLAQLVGLEVSQAGHRGWARTRLRPEAIKLVQSLNAKSDAFHLFRSSHESKAPTKLLKWVCGCTNLRCATALDASCNRCGGKFTRA